MIPTIDTNNRRVVPEPNSGCWLWTGSDNGRGYGMLRPAGKKGIFVHRLAWEQNFGPIPEGMLVCHKCDVPRCVNPQHLFLGTPADNMTDKVNKGRQARGERQSEIMRRVTRKGELVNTAKLTPVQVIEIRNAEGNNCVVARRYGVSNALVSLIRRRRIWKHL